MSRWISISSIACAQALLLALPAVAASAPSAPPDGGADYVLESGPAISHTWNPGAAAGGGLQSSSAQGRAQSFSSGAGGGAGSAAGGRSSAESLVFARTQASSTHAKGDSAAPVSSTPPLAFGAVLTALSGGPLTFSSGTKKIFACQAVGGSRIACDAYDVKGRLYTSPDWVVTLSEHSTSGTSRNRKLIVDLTAISQDDGGYSLTGTFTSPAGSAGTVTGAPFEGNPQRQIHVTAPFEKGPQRQIHVTAPFEKDPQRQIHVRYQHEWQIPSRSDDNLER